MTSHVRMESFQWAENGPRSTVLEGRPDKPTRSTPKGPECQRGKAGNSSEEHVNGELLAQTLEFVARPGQTEKLQKAIRPAIRKVHESCEGFVGCLVLVSEQEERLVTVITLWAGTEKEQREEIFGWVKNLLEPYVDSWLRPRRFVKLLSSPEIFATAGAGREEAGLVADRVA